MKEMREGYTTGTCAAAGAKAAASALINKEISEKITVKLLNGGYLDIPVKEISIEGDYAQVSIVKDAGDDPDITNGKDIVVRLRLNKKAIYDDPVIYKAGTGVGIVTKPGLPVAPGEPAINPNPRKMIYENLEPFFKPDLQFEVEISVPEGEMLAKKTLNPHLGIVGGISILGTTGIVKPMSEEAFKVSLVPQLKTALAIGHKAIVLTPGNIGMESAVRNGVPEDAVVITSNFIGYMLENAVDIGFKDIILWGHIGKIVKVAGGNFYTHNRISDSRMEILAAVLALHGAPQELIKDVMHQITTEAAQKIISEQGYDQIWETIADMASQRSERFLFSQARVGTVLLKDRKDILFINQKTREIGEQNKWNIFQ